MISGNKGEWSEIYVLFKLLADGKLDAGDENLEKIHDVVYPILKIIRTEKTGVFEYSIEDEIVVISGNDILKVSVVDFKKQAQKLLELIKAEAKGSFSLPDVEQFMKEINCLSLKAGSTQKTDITIVVHDEKTNQQPSLGFSIKSQLGASSTLLNASKATNFLYKITGASLSEEDILQINEINSRSKIMDRILAIKDKGGVLEYDRTEKSIFCNNLVMIDSCLPEILSGIVLNFFSSKLSSMNELAARIEQDNPLGYNFADHHQFYHYKIKRFLMDIAVGMMPAKMWDGQYDATGGYLIVRQDGKILCYHLYNRNRFEDYLFNNTKLETPSSSRHDFGKLYQKNGATYFKLNLQIRFTQ